MPHPRDAESLLQQYADDSELVGVFCIAKGTDSLFAEAVPAAGGRLTVVIPSQDYRQNKVKPDHARLFDRLVAVWNGEPPSGKGGGTADTVLEAQAAGIPVDVVWPDGVARKS